MWEGPHAGGGLRSSTPEEEGAAETVCDELTSAPMHVKFSLEKKGEVGERFFYDLVLNLITLL